MMGGVTAVIVGAIICLKAESVLSYRSDNTGRSEAMFAVLD